MTTHVDKRSLWQVAEIFGWVINDIKRVKDFYLRPAILIPFADHFFDWRLKDGKKLGARATIVAELAMEVMDGNPTRWISNLEQGPNPPIAECDVYFTVIIIRACCLPGGEWAAREDNELQAMVDDAVQIVKILNNQFELIPKKGVTGADLPSDMYREAQRLGHYLNLGVVVPDRAGRGQNRRKPMAATIKALNSKATMQPAAKMQSTASMISTSNIKGNKRNRRSRAVKEVARTMQPRRTMQPTNNTKNNNDSRQRQSVKDVVVAAPNTFDTVFKEFKLFYPCVKTVEDFRFSVISLAYILKLQKTPTEILPSFFDMYVYLHPTWLRVREAVLRGGKADQYSYVKWLEKQEVGNWERCLTWEIIEELVGSGDGKACLEMYRDLVKRSSLQF